MFTGIITAVGSVQECRAREGGRDLMIVAPGMALEAGESIAVDGACLTVTQVDADAFTVHVVATSLDRTRFATYVVQQQVNLERALRVGDRLGGHIVQGHVDGNGTITGVVQREDARLLDIQVPVAIVAVTVPLGSITVDGVSLTVNAIPAAGVVQVSLIPFTLVHTTLGGRVAGDRVHLEGDAVGKYVQHLMAAWRATESR